jgi:hypothetical protein
VRQHEEGAQAQVDDVRDVCKMQGMSLDAVRLLKPEGSGVVQRFHMHLLGMTALTNLKLSVNADWSSAV